MSLLFTFIASRILVVSSSLSQSIFDKGSSFSLRISIKRPMILLPMMPYSMTYDFGNGIFLTDEGKDTGGMFSRELIREVTFMCRYAGGGSIALMDMNLTDFFGIMSFKVKNVDKTPHFYGIIPQIPQTGTDPGKLKLVMESADMSDKEQEMSLDTADNFGGFPGYDHREYVDGDPVKRINYKLSARKDELFVRLDEKQVYGSVESSVLSSDVIVEAGAEVVYSILMPGARVCAGAKVRYAIIGEKTVIGSGAVHRG